jgi:hypothetical protein
MNNEKLIQLAIGGKTYYLNPAHIVAVLPINPTNPEVRLYLTRDALDSLPKENSNDLWVTLYDDCANAVLKRFGLSQAH